MSEANRERLWADMMGLDHNDIELEVHRETIQEGRSFSAEAMEQLYDQMVVWVGTRLMRRWETTGEPPTVMTVELNVTVG